MKFLLISGSLREDSYNTRLLKYVAKKFLKEHNVKYADISKFPIYSDDSQEIPDEVKKFKSEIREAQIIIFASPEHNWSFSAALKNAIDWASRPPNDSAWDGKIGLIISASTGMLGGARGQYHLRQVLNSVNMILVTKPEIFISFAQDKLKGDSLDDKNADSLIASAISNAIKLYEVYHREA